MLRIATPLILGTLGVLLCERAGVLNLGIEGIMVAGAFAGWLVVYRRAHRCGPACWRGRATGALLGVLHGWLTVLARAVPARRRAGVDHVRDQRRVLRVPGPLPEVATPPTIEPFAEMHGIVDAIPVLGPVLDAQTPLTLLALLMVPALAWLLYRTPAGLALRMVGENPAAAEAPGIPVAAMRIAAVTRARR